MGSGLSTATSKRTRKPDSQAESSRVLFLLYLIHRTWNVLVEHVDAKSARWRGSHTVPSSRRFDSASMPDSDPGTCYSSCSCSYCQLRECAQDCVRKMEDNQRGSLACTQQDQTRRQTDHVATTTVRDAAPAASQLAVEEGGAGSEVGVGVKIEVEVIRRRSDQSGAGSEIDVAATRDAVV